MTAHSREPRNAGTLLLEGRFVRLEPLQVDHIPALVRAASEDRSSYGFTHVPNGEAEMCAYVEAALAGREQGACVPFATISRETGEVVGTTRFANFGYYPWPPGSPLQRGDHLPDEVEIGWTWLAASAQRTAINTDAKLQMLRHAFEEWQVYVVRLKTDRRNERSRNAILRLGTTFDGILRAHSPASDGTMRDSAYYSLRDTEFGAVRANLEARLAARG